MQEQPWLVHFSATDQRTMPASTLRAAVQAGAVAPQTMVWRAGMSSWAPVGSIAELMPPSQPGLGWDAPLAPPPQAASAQLAAEQYLSTHGSGLGHTTTYAAWDPPPGQAPRRHAAPAGSGASELVATGLVVFGIVMFTSYMLSLGGAFESGGAARHEAPSRTAK